MLAFTARRTEGIALLEWSTASEMNNRFFEIQRMFDNTDFEVIGKVEGAGNSKISQSYQFVDANAPSSKAVYYRLRQVDFDGQFAYSTIAALGSNENTMVLRNEIKLYPNPVNRMEPLRVELLGDWGEVNYQVQNMSGNISVEGKIVSGGQIVTNNLNPGIYMVKIYNEDDARTTKVIVR